MGKVTTASPLAEIYARYAELRRELFARIGLSVSDGDALSTIELTRRVYELDATARADFFQQAARIDRTMKVFHSRRLLESAARSIRANGRATGKDET